MTRQWIRECRLTVEGGGSALDLSGLRIRFYITKDPLQRTNFLDATITNISKETANRLLGKEFSTVRLSAGYRGAAAEIFVGNIIQVRHGRENPTDTYLNIIARDGDKAYNFAVVNKTLKAGSTGKDVYDELLKVMKPFDIVEGFVTEKLKELKFIRPVVLWGDAKNHLRWLAGTVNGFWSIQDGKLDLIHKDEEKPGDTVVINAQTGMIGMPEQTFDGILVRALINPRIALLRQIKINNASIQMAKFDLSWNGNGGGGNPGPSNGGGDAGINNPIGKNAWLPDLAADGVYRVWKIDWQGDTRGNPWYMDLWCLKRGESRIPIKLTPYGG